MKKERKSKAEKSQQDDDALQMDDRYSEITTNPLFREIARKERKVVLDKRFKGIFNDKRFATTESKIDKHGRPIVFGKHESLEMVYEMDSDESDTSESEAEEATDGREIRLDLARGEGNVSSSDEEENEEEEEENTPIVRML
jgi:hypothetical protein